MAVAAGIMVPHPPLIVPDVGRGQEILIKDTIKAYQEAAGMAAELKPDTIVVISPHAVMYADYFHVSPGKEARGDFGRFMAPQIGVEAGYDEAFVRELDRLCGDDDFPMGTEGEREKELLGCRDGELMMIKGITYKEEPEPFEYFEIVAVSDLYEFRSVTRL